MYLDDTRMGPGDRWSPHRYGPPDSNDGEDIWEKLVRKHKNIFLVLSGHVCGDGTGTLTSQGDHGNIVHQLLADYQDATPNGGNGWLRILRFSPRNDKIHVRTYSPWLNAMSQAADQCFDLDYDMTAPHEKNTPGE